MGLTFNSICCDPECKVRCEDITTSFIRNKLKPIIDNKPKSAQLPMSEFIDGLGLKGMPVGGVEALVDKLKIRGNIIITKGEMVVNEGPPVDADLVVENWKDERFELATRLTGRFQQISGRVIGLMDLEGFSLGNSGVTWIKFIIGKGIYIKRGITGLHYFLDWHFEPPTEAWRWGIDDEVKKLAGT